MRDQVRLTFLLQSPAKSPLTRGLAGDYAGKYEVDLAGDEVGFFGRSSRRKFGRSLIEFH